MSVEKTCVFISSRFDEFSALRKALAERLNKDSPISIHVVDLDDNSAETIPPTAVCINWIRQSELLILILGDSYGSCVQGEQVSYTHLEYRTAIAEESDTRVLPFFVGGEVPRDDAPASSDSMLAKFRCEVMQNHRVGIHPRPSRDEEWAKLTNTIFKEAVKAIWELGYRDLNQESDEDVPEDEDIAGESASEAARLDSLRRERSSDLALLKQVSVIESSVDAAKQPMAVAAAEQLGEARLALEIGERVFAEHHLRAAIKLRPLEPVANEWLARILLSKGRVKHIQEAMCLADCAARIYGKTDHPLRAAAASILAARAAGLLDRERGIEYARNAIEYAGWYGQAHLELARQLAQSGVVDEALKSLRSSFECYPAALDFVTIDPAFEGMQDSLAKFVRELLGKIRDVARKACVAEARLMAELGRSSNVDPDWALDDKLSRLVYGCRRSVLRQLKFLQAQAIDCLYADAVNADIPDDIPVCVLDAASLTFSASRQIEVISILVREDQVVSAGTNVLKYSGLESGRIHYWCAPVHMRISRVSHKLVGRTISGAESILTWAPAPKEVATRHELTSLLESSQLGKNKLNARHTDLTGSHLMAKTSLWALIMSSGLFALLPGIAHEGGIATVLSVALAAACAWYAFKRWRVVRKLRMNIEHCIGELKETDHSIGLFERGLQSLTNTSRELHRRLATAAAHWEGDAVSLFAATMPFPGLRAALAGDWVVILPKTVKSYGRGVGLDVTFLPGSEPVEDGRLVVYRVIGRDGGNIVLGRDSVFFPRQRTEI